jgi:hypothetical protein
MIKRIFTVLVFGVIFLGLLIPQDSLEALKPNLNAAQAKSAVKTQGAKSSNAKSKAGKKKSKSKGKKAGASKGKAAKAAAVKKIREAQRILDKAFGPKAKEINRQLNQLNSIVKKLK